MDSVDSGGGGIEWEGLNECGRVESGKVAGRFTFSSVGIRSFIYSLCRRQSIITAERLLTPSLKLFMMPFG